MTRRSSDGPTSAPDGRPLGVTRWVVGFVVASLLALAVIPPVLSFRTEGHRRAITEVVDPARDLLENLPRPFLLQVQALDRLAEDPSVSALEDYRQARQAIDAELERLEDLLSGEEDLLGLVEALRRDLLEWNELHEPYLAGDPSIPAPDEAVQEGRTELYRSMLQTMTALGEGLMAHQALHREAIEEARVVGAVASPILAGLALISGLFVFHFGRRVRTVGDELEERARRLEERARAEEEARTRAEAAVKARDQVLAMVTHDLRTPVNAVLGAAQLLLEEELPESARRRQLWVVRRQARQMERLIEDLVDEVRLRVGTVSIRPEPVPVGRFLQEVRAAHLGTAGRNDVELRVVRTPPDATVYADPARLRQVLDNLLDNAFRYAPSGSEVRIEVRRDGGGEHLRFAVSDGGPGIPEDELPHLFEPHWQSDRRARGRAGLGLPTVRSIVELHGGEIEVESEEGRGARFVFTLPSASAALAVESVETAADARGTAAGGSGGGAERTGWARGRGRRGANPASPDGPEPRPAT